MRPPAWSISATRACTCSPPAGQAWTRPSRWRCRGRMRAQWGCSWSTWRGTSRRRCTPSSSSIKRAGMTSGPWSVPGQITLLPLPTRFAKIEPCRAGLAVPARTVSLASRPGRLQSRAGGRLPRLEQAPRRTASPNNPHSLSISHEIRNSLNGVLQPSWLKTHRRRTGNQGERQSKDGRLATMSRP